ncbi:SRPBCC domain-containing protein [Nesterenkonia sp. MY13]|uniref:SRPBCC domain-containing protein n=1 Tax=Nesterenkonia sedimenti TaxID=1463632 RepID=A0A7X8TGX4_9MICC|nr:SRPBCC domain-containing protein [Nesterenkonia sedimenti]NLS08495.1 SRPBCC domain-containing protein [Nesterenkonia sedimenti]
MPITDVTKDPENLSLTIMADFPVSVRRLWDAYVDPRQLEKFWGPPEYPATFIRHDLYPGGKSFYYMTGPSGNRSYNYWEFLSVEVGQSFEVISGLEDCYARLEREVPVGA